MRKAANPDSIHSIQFLLQVFSLWQSVEQGQGQREMQGGALLRFQQSQVAGGAVFLVNAKGVHLCFIIVITAIIPSFPESSQQSQASPMMKPALETVSLSDAVAQCLPQCDIARQGRMCRHLFCCSARLNVEIVHPPNENQKLYPDVATLSMLFRLCLLSANFLWFPSHLGLLSH